MEYKFVLRFSTFFSCRIGDSSGTRSSVLAAEEDIECVQHIKRLLSQYTNNLRWYHFRTSRNFRRSASMISVCCGK